MRTSSLTFEFARKRTFRSYKDKFQMKYFTPEWWRTGCENAREIFEKYDAYLATVRARLPKDLVLLEAEHTLHDSEVKRIKSDFAEGTAELLLHGWNRPLEEKVRYTLQFSGVILFDQVLPTQEYVEQELGDLGYWECELVPEGVEVRMLFVSGAEFRIVFTGFTLKHESG